MNKVYSIQNLPHEVMEHIVSFLGEPCYCKKNNFKNILFVNKYFFNLLENHSNKIKKTCVNIKFKNMHKVGFSNRYNFCKTHEKKLINYYYALKINNVNNFLDRIIESDVKNCLDYGYLFNNTLDKLENNNTGGFFHFSSVEEADKNMDIFKNHFKDIFTFGDRCCGGLGIQVRYTNGLKLL